ncbi:MAG: hypothetical protein ACK5KL_08845, partial [Dysgonomonas sp.]
MTPEDWSSFGAAFEKEHGISIKAAFEEVKEEKTAPELPKEIIDSIQGSINDAFETTGTKPPVIDPSSFNTAISGIVTAMQSMAQNMATMGKDKDSGTPVAIVGARQDPYVFARTLGHAPHTNEYLFGIESNYFKRGSWWTELVVSGKEREEDYRDEDATAFRAAFNNYAKDFKARCLKLAESNQVGLLDFNKMVHGESFIDYSQMNEKLGEYVVRRMDMIIAYLRTLKSVSGIFRVVSGVQNKMKAPTAFFGELSQSYKSGHYFKGNVNFDGEIYQVADIMMKFAFEDPKQLEKEYIGYMNREGSNPMKWNLFEWIIVHFGTILFNEQQRRRVIGRYVPRQGDFPQPAMLAADGALRGIQRVEDERKVLPFKDLKVYTENTIGDYASTFWKYVMAILPNMQGMQLHINEKHQPWYIEWYDEKYGQKTDYTGPKNNIRHLSPDNLVWVPNMDMNDYKMWITVPGNVENYEFNPNEMYAFYFQQDLEVLIMASWWKEGSGVLAPGVQFPTLQELIDSKRAYQFLFTNYPVTTLDADAVALDGELNTLFETGANTAATAISTINNASRDRVYRVICGNLTNKTTIAKSGIFSDINSAWTPTAVGDYIDLYAQLQETTQVIGGKSVKVVEMTGKFLELERKVS